VSKHLAITYTEAIKLLGVDNRLEALDNGISLALIGATAAAPLVAPVFLAVKEEIITLLSRQRAAAREKALRSSGITCLKALAAAHAVIVVASFMEELSKVVAEVLPTPRVRRPRWRKQKDNAELVRLLVPDDHGQRNRYVHLVDWADQVGIEPPGPARPISAVQPEVHELAVRFAKTAADFLDKSDSRFTEQQRAELRRSLADSLPDRVSSAYFVNCLKLANDVPLFLTWISISIWEGQYRAQREIKEINEARADLIPIERDRRPGMAAMSRMQDYIYGKPATPAVPADDNDILVLHRNLQESQLDKPIFPRGRTMVASDPTFPTVRSGYISPRFRVYAASRSDDAKSLTNDAWWREKLPEGRDRRPVMDGIGAYLLEYFSTPAAVFGPLVVLGLPGSGKSLFSKTAADLLRADRYVVVTISLHDTPPRHGPGAQINVYDQVDRSVRSQSNGSYNWRELSDRARDLTIVVIFDGLDELLQLPGSEYLAGYLEEVQRFQETEANLNHPTIAVVTARTLVMDGLYLPEAGQFIRLEDFDSRQVSDCLKAWNDQNDKYFKNNRLNKCSPKTIAPYADLARQPLLLAMLALYDAQANALQTDGAFSKADLYERIFHEFTMRELAKGQALTPEHMKRRAEECMGELSLVAIALFKSGSKTISGKALDQDLTRWNASVTADAATNQFFFAYSLPLGSLAGSKDCGYQFLHPTFGEFLVARSMLRTLITALPAVDGGDRWNRDERAARLVADLRRYLGYHSLVGADQVIEFFVALSQAEPDLNVVIPVLLRAVYSVVKDEAPPAAGVLSLNLVFLALVIRGGPLDLGADALGDVPADGWRKLRDLWESTLERSEWELASDYLEPGLTFASDGAVVLNLDRHGDVTLSSGVSDIGKVAARNVLDARINGQGQRQAANRVALLIDDELASARGRRSPGASRADLTEIARSLVGAPR
jgi:hypothetical protein